MSRLASALLLILAGCASSPSLRVAVFECDATPPIGHPLAGRDTLETVEAPLLLKGLLLEDGDDRFVVAALDWCTLNADDYRLFRIKLAWAADAPVSNVTVHCTHTHSAPSRRDRNLSFVHRVTEVAATAVCAARARLRTFTHVATGRARVVEFASSRRVPNPYDSISVRWSRTTDPFLIQAPEGAIDPWLRTVSLLDGDVPIARMHFYASHPQSHYGDGRSHPDVPGWARSRLEKRENIPHLYFTGCAGDVAAGKYNDGSPKARARLIDRLTAGMDEAIRRSTAHPVRSIELKTSSVALPRRPEDQPPEGGAVLPPVDFLLLRLGPADLLFLPGEPFVEYQLHAQSVRPDRFVAVAAYGDGSPGYVCTDAAYHEGGYEPRGSRSGPPVERVFKNALSNILDP